MTKQASSNWITLKILAKEVGVSVKHLQRLCRKGILPHTKPTGRLILVSRDEFDIWLSENQIKTQKDKDSKAQFYNVKKRAS